MKKVGEGTDLGQRQTKGPHLEGVVLKTLPVLVRAKGPRALLDLTLELAARCPAVGKTKMEEQTARRNWP